MRSERAGVESAKEAAVDALVAERAWVARLARRMVRDRDEADDVAQDAMVAALASPPPAAALAPRGWLGRVATNVVRQRYRSAGRRSAREERSGAEPSGEGPPDAAAALQREQARGLLVRAVGALDEPYRTAVLLRFVDEKSVAEVAAAQGCPVGTAGWRIAEGVKRLRARLDGEAGGDARPWLMALAPDVGVDPGSAASATNPAAVAASTRGGMTMTKLVSLVLALVCAGALMVFRGLLRA